MPDERVCQYAIQWQHFVLSLRAGIGTGAGSALFADISRVTTVEERTGVMSVFMAVRQLGLLAGSMKGNFSEVLI